jgi:hypothetical protein
MNQQLLTQAPVSNVIWYSQGVWEELKRANEREVRVAHSAKYVP